ncbi:MAG: DUF4406 domain-containing protein [Vibrio sp.]
MTKINSPYDLLIKELDDCCQMLNPLGNVKKIYIAGPMGGLPDENRKTFHTADVLFSNMGYSVLNPALLPDGLEQHEYMDICLAMVRSCDSVFMLPGWEDSLGAQAEYHLAKKLGKYVFSAPKISDVAGSMPFAFPVEL